MKEKRQVIITGVSRGIGRETALSLLEKGYSVIGISREAASCGINDVNYTPLPIDLSDLDRQEKELKSLKNTLKAVDAIILSAGAGLFGNLEELSTKEIHRLFKLNILSAMTVTKIFLPIMKKQKKGDIIFIGSEAALEGKRKATAYSATKFAMRGFAQALRDETATSNVRVTLINPGMVKTPFFETLPFQPGSKDEEHILPEDIAKLISTLLECRAGTVVEEINLSPQKQKVIFKTRVV